MPRALRAFAVFCGHSLRFAARRYSVSRHNRRYNFQRKVFSYMCGFVGFTGNIVNRDKILRNMANRIIHRGPDMEGFHMSGNEPSDFVNLGFRRLSIIDLSDGAQPMYNEDGSVVVVFNGEIYNFMDLRRELAEPGTHFQDPLRYRGHCSRLGGVRREPCRTSSRNVRVCRMGYAYPYDVRSARLFRNQAVLLFASPRREHAFRLRNKKLSRAPVVPARGQPGRTPSVSYASVFRNRGDVFQGNVQASAGALFHLPRRSDEENALLGCGFFK